MSRTLKEMSPVPQSLSRLSFTRHLSVRGKRAVSADHRPSYPGLQAPGLQVHTSTTGMALMKTENSETPEWLVGLFVCGPGMPFKIDVLKHN